MTELEERQKAEELVKEIARTSGIALLEEEDELLESQIKGEG